MRVAQISGLRASVPMGLESAELQLAEALRRTPFGSGFEVRVVGGRAGRAYAREIGARWIPSIPGRLPRRATARAELVHLLGLDLPPPSGSRYVVTVHDVASALFADESPLPPWAMDAVARAERVFTVSRFSAGEIHDRLGVPEDRIRVIPNGPGQVLAPQSLLLTDSELRALGITRPFVLRMGGYTQRKNVSVLLEAWPGIHADTGAQLVLAGPAHPARQAQLEAAPALRGVVVVDYLDGRTLMKLLRAATVLVSTSTYEGFGLPALEAMLAATAVAAVDIPPVREVCDDAALFMENNPRSVQHGVTRLLSDDEARERLVRAGAQRAAAFTWEAAAECYVEEYERLLHGRDDR